MSSDVKVGVCSRCGNELALIEGVDCWHPWNAMPEGGCPPEDWVDGPGSMKLPLWGTTGRPGVEYWRPLDS